MQYLAGLRDGRAVYYRGERVADVTTHPELGRAARHCAIDYAFADDPGHRDLARCVEDGVEINRFYKLPRRADDLLRRRELIAETTRAGHALIVLVREIGTDFLCAAHLVTQDMQERLCVPYHDRFRAFYGRLQDATLNARPAVYVVWIALTLLCLPMFNMSSKELAPTEDQGVIFGIVINVASIEATSAKGRREKSSVHLCPKSVSEVKRVVTNYALLLAVFCFPFAAAFVKFSLTLN